jgi:hypothetical protein
MNSDFELDQGRRRTLVTGGTLLAGLLGPQVARADQAGTSQAASSSAGSGNTLPVSEMQTILRSQGTVREGVLSIEQDRNDLDNVVGPGGIPWKPSFQIQNELHFQAIGAGRAIFNGELSLLDRETNPVIDRIVANGLVFQAFHQHFFDLKPQLWHIHFRGIGAPLDLARAVAKVIAATGTPLPQTRPPHPSTPLNAELLADILGGDAQIDEDGVVHVTVPRKDQIILAGVPVKSEMGVDHNIGFEPLGGNRTAVGPDFALTASEVNPVMAITRKYGFTVHCLYNQETAENPQLYFSHQLAVGDAYDLARVIRRALEKTNTRFSS